MLSSISTLQSLAKYNTKSTQIGFNPANWNVTNSFSMVRMTWAADSSVSASVGKLLRIVISRSDSSAMTTRFYAYVRCGNSTTKILTTYGNLTNSSNISITFTATSTVLLNQITELIVTGLSFNTSYNVSLEFDSSTTGTISKLFTIQTYNYGSNAVTPSLFKFTPWKRTTVTYYKTNITASDAPTNWTHPTLYTDVSGKGFWVMRETSALMSTNAKATGQFPDQVTRAMDGATDRGALIWGVQSTSVIKTTTAYSFQSSSTYVLSCMVVERSGETINNSIDVYIDPSSGSNYTGAIKIGTITAPAFSVDNFLYTSFTYNTPSNFTTGNYYIRLLGTATTDNSLLVSNCDLVKTA